MVLKWTKLDIYCFELHSFIRNMENTQKVLKLVNNSMLILYKLNSFTFQKFKK